MKKPSIRAFTLIEILVTVAIIGLLAGLLINNTGKIFGSSQEMIAKVFVRDTLKTVMEKYKLDMGSYPSSAEGLSVLLVAPSNGADNWHGPYTDVPGGKLPLDPWGESYQYRYPGTHNTSKYDLFSKGPDKTEGTEDDIGNW